MPVAAPVLLVAAAIAGMAATTHSWTRQRTARLHAEIDSDIRQMLRRHAARKQDLAATELLAPAGTTGAGRGRDDDPGRKALDRLDP